MTTDNPTPPPTIGNITFSQQPLDLYWLNMLNAWKEDAQKYEAALKAIRGVLDKDMDDACRIDEIEVIVGGVFDAQGA